MATHYWGDTNFDWLALNDAINHIEDYCTKYGSISIHGKEKWGCADIYADFWDGSIFTLLYSRRNWRMTKKWPSWLRDIDFKLADLLRFLKVTDLVHKYQIFIYRRAYDQALTKWPHIKEEIVGGMAHWELLEDVMVKHKLTQNFRSDDCHANKHLYNKKGYCSKCFSFKTSEDQK